MKKTYRFTAEQRDQIAADVAGGMSLGEAARKWGCRVNSVSRLCMTRGILAKGSVNWSPTPAHHAAAFRAAAEALEKAGFSLFEGASGDSITPSVLQWRRTVEETL